jgi:hypothetical protein
MAKIPFITNTKFFKGIRMKNWLGQAGNLNLIISHPLDPNRWAFRQHSRTIPNIKDKNAAVIQMLPRGLKRR